MVSISLGASTKLDKSGGTLTGPLILSRDPVEDLEPATKRWVLANGGGIPPGTATTKGDLLAATGSAAITRLGVGTDGQVLTAASGQATGLQWTTLPTSPSPLPLSAGGTGATDAAGARTRLGLGSAATADTGAFDAAGAATAAQAAAESSAAGLYLPLAGGSLSGVLALGGHKVTGLANGAVSTDAAAFGQIPLPGSVTAQLAFGLDPADGTAPTWARSDHSHGTPSELDYAAEVFGLVAAPFSPYLCNTINLGLTSGFALFTLVRPGAVTLTNLGTWVGTASTTGTGVNAMALYSEAGVLIDQTGDMTALLSGATANSYVEAPLAGGPRTLDDATNYYFAILCHNSAAPRIAGYFQTTAVTVPGIKGHFGSVQLSGQTSFPASFTPSSATKNNAVYWLAGS